MTSQINYTDIDETFPVAGQDNDSVGFRNNFNTIKLALEQTKSEITELHSKAVLKENVAPIVGDPEADNNLAGSTIRGGYYRDMAGYSTINDGITSASTLSERTIDASASSLYVLGLAGSTDFAITGWASDTFNSFVRVHFYGDTHGTYNITLDVGAGTLIPEAGFDPVTFSVGADDDEGVTAVHAVLEFWSYNNGATVFVRSLGTYAVAV